MVINPLVNWIWAGSASSWSAPGSRSCRSGLSRSRRAAPGGDEPAAVCGARRGAMARMSGRETATGSRGAAARSSAGRRGRSRGRVRPWHLLALEGLAIARRRSFAAPGAAGGRVRSPSRGSVGLGRGRGRAELLPLAARRRASGRNARRPDARRARAREDAGPTDHQGLEFDRAMGKVSEADYGDVGRLRARALPLMRQLDQAARLPRSSSASWRGAGGVARRVPSRRRPVERPRRPRRARHCGVETTPTRGSARRAAQEARRPGELTAPWIGSAVAWASSRSLWALRRARCPTRARCRVSRADARPAGGTVSIRVVRGELSNMSWASLSSWTRDRGPSGDDRRERADRLQGLAARRHRARRGGGGRRAPRVAFECRPIGGMRLMLVASQAWRRPRPARCRRSRRARSRSGATAGSSSNSTTTRWRCSTSSTS